MSSKPHFSLLILSLILTLTAADDAAVMSKLAAAFTSPPIDWTGTSYCNWSGVSCDSDKVTSINLVSKSLSGTLPAELSQLSQLKTLSLQRNSLSGTLPSFANLTSLQEIYLDSNDFSLIPQDFLLGLPSLQYVSLSDNPKLSPWQIPIYLSESTTLTTFTASNTSIFGLIPDFFDSFPNIQNLRLAYNNLSGVLPQTFGGSKIRNLWLHNQVHGLSGSVHVLSSMTQLSQVWLHANSFTGPVPDLSNCLNLFDLQLRDNQFTGVLPPSLTDLPKLVNISLQNNKLQGECPVFKSGVKVIIEDTNSFCRNISGPCDPQVNVLLSIAGAFGYPMPLAQAWTGNDACAKWTFVTCDPQGKSVTVLNFTKQHFSGTISPAFAKLPLLQSLLLSENNLTGSIPESLTTLDQLEVLDVSENNLDGVAPTFDPLVNFTMTGNSLLERNASYDGDGDAGGSPRAYLRPLGIVFGVTGIVLCVYMCYNKKKHRRSGANNRLQRQSGGTQRIHSRMPVFEVGNLVISVQALRQVTNNFSENNIIGRGGFGVVYKGELHDGTHIAIKRMKSRAMSTGLDDFQAEIAVLTKVRHRRLVALLGYCTNDNERCLVYEYMAQGTLSQHLFKHQELGYSTLSWKQRLIIALDVVRGIEYLHSLAESTFIHRDLKPDNILLGNDMRAKVADFGLVKGAPDSKQSVETRVAGTYGYLAPEYVATAKVTTKVDVYAFGAVLMELITGRKALDTTMSDERIHLVTWFRRIVFNKDAIREAMDQTLNPDEKTFDSICLVAELARHCTARKPDKRPHMGHAVYVLSPLIGEWKSSSSEVEDSSEIDLHRSLHQTFQTSQYDDSTSIHPR